MKDKNKRLLDAVYGPEYFNGRRSFFYRLSGGYRNLSSVFDRHASHIFRYATGGRLLDIGCAYGFLLERLENRFETYGIDISHYAIEAAGKRLKKSEVLRHDICRPLPFPDEFFDVAVATDILEHVRKPEQTLKNITRILKPGGLLYITGPNNNLLRQLVFQIPDYMEHHVSLMHITEMVARLKRLGYEILEKWTLLSAVFKIRFPSSIGPEMAIIARRGNIRYSARPRLQASTSPLQAAVA